MSAQAIRCDYTGCPELADVLISTLANGDTLAWCFPHYVDAARAIVEATEAAEREATDEAAIERIEAAPPAEPAIEPAVTVRRGTSKSRRDFEGRRKRRGAEPAAGATPPEPGPDDPTDEPTDEPAAPEGAEPVELPV